MEKISNFLEKTSFSISDITKATDFLLLKTDFNEKIKKILNILLSIVSIKELIENLENKKLEKTLNLNEIIDFSLKKANELIGNEFFKERILKINLDLDEDWFKDVKIIDFYNEMRVIRKKTIENTLKNELNLWLKNWDVEKKELFNDQLQILKEKSIEYCDIIEKIKILNEINDAFKGNLDFKKIDEILQKDIPEEFLQWEGFKGLLNISILKESLKNQQENHDNIDHNNTLDSKTLKKLMKKFFKIQINETLLKQTIDFLRKINKYSDFLIFFPIISQLELEISKLNDFHNEISNFFLKYSFYSKEFLQIYSLKHQEILQNHERFIKKLIFTFKITNPSLYESIGIISLICQTAKILQLDQKYTLENWQLHCIRLEKQSLKLQKFQIYHDFKLYFQRIHTFSSNLSVLKKFISNYQKIYSIPKKYFDSNCFLKPKFLLKQNFFKRKNRFAVKKELYESIIRDYNEICVDFTLENDDISLFFQQKEDLDILYQNISREKPVPQWKFLYFLQKLEDIPLELPIYEDFCIGIIEKFRRICHNGEYEDCEVLFHGLEGSKKPKQNNFIDLNACNFYELINFCDLEQENQSISKLFRLKIGFLKDFLKRKNGGDKIKFSILKKELEKAIYFKNLGELRNEDKAEIGFLEDLIKKYDEKIKDLLEKNYDFCEFNDDFIDFEQDFYDFKANLMFNKEVKNEKNNNFLQKIEIMEKKNEKIIFKKEEKNLKNKIIKKRVKRKIEKNVEIKKKLIFNELSEGKIKINQENNNIYRENLNKNSNTRENLNKNNISRENLNKKTTQKIEKNIKIQDSQQNKVDSPIKIQDYLENSIKNDKEQKSALENLISKSNKLEEIPYLKPILFDPEADYPYNFNNLKEDCKEKNEFTKEENEFIKKENLQNAISLIGKTKNTKRIDIIIKTDQITQIDEDSEENIFKNEEKNECFELENVLTKKIEDQINNDNSSLININDISKISEKNSKIRQIETETPQKKLEMIPVPNVNNIEIYSENIKTNKIHPLELPKLIQIFDGELPFPPLKVPSILLLFNKISFLESSYPILTFSSFKSLGATSFTSFLSYYKAFRENSLYIFSIGFLIPKSNLYQIKKFCNEMNYNKIVRGFKFGELGCATFNFITPEQMDNDFILKNIRNKCCKELEIEIPLFFMLTCKKEKLLFSENRIISKIYDGDKQFLNFFKEDNKKERKNFKKIENKEENNKVDQEFILRREQSEVDIEMENLVHELKNLDEIDRQEFLSSYMPENRDKILNLLKIN